MLEQKPRHRVDRKEFELPETHFVRTVEDKVFQSIVVQCLANVEGIGLVEGNLLDNLLGRECVEGVKGILIEQDNRQHAVSVKVELNVMLGVSIPDKSEEIQSKIAKSITEMTGLHVSSVHLIFKNVIPDEKGKKEAKPGFFPYRSSLQSQQVQERYNDAF